MAIVTWTKDPDSVLDYALDWADWLADAEVISDSEWVVPSGIHVDSESHTLTAAVIWLSGGELGKSYELTNRITTSDGRIDDRSLKISVKQR